MQIILDGIYSNAYLEPVVVYILVFDHPNNTLKQGLLYPKYKWENRLTSLSKLPASQIKK